VWSGKIQAEGGNTLKMGEGNTAEKKGSYKYLWELSKGGEGFKTKGGIYQREGRIGRGGRHLFFQQQTGGRGDF